MDFIRNLFTLFQRLQDIIREGQKRGDVPGMAMALVREVRGSDRDADRSVRRSPVAPRPSGAPPS